MVLVNFPILCESLFITVAYINVRDELYAKKEKDGPERDDECNGPRRNTTTAEDWVAIM